MNKGLFLPLAALSVGLGVGYLLGSGSDPSADRVARPDDVQEAGVTLFFKGIDGELLWRMLRPSTR